MRRIYGLFVIPLLLLVVFAGPGSTALAAPKARVVLSMPTTVNEHAAIPFSWSGRNLGRNHRLVIQRPAGTSRTWRNVMRLSSNRGSSQLPGLPLGTHQFRIADIVERRVLAQQVVTIEAFGPVPFSSLLDTGTPGVHATPTSSFPFVDSWEDTRAPAISVARNHCQAVHVGFVGMLGSSYGTPGVARVTVVQESRDPVTGSAPFEVISSIDAQLVPGQTWAINVTPEQTNGGLTFTFLNGYAVCSSAEPF